MRDEFGGEAIWPFQGTGTLGYLQGLEGRAGQRLWNVLGASRHDMTICSVAGRVGATYVTGTAAGMDPETFAHSKLILLWGTNTLTSGHHLWKFILAARKNGAHIVAIDPLRTRTAAQADEHLAPLPGTDAALALGLLHVIVAMDAQDDAYLAAHTVGWEAFRERILEFPPSRVAAITGLDEDVIVALGRRIATTRPTGIRCTMGMQRHAGGGNALRLLYALPGVTGDWQYPGGGASYSTSGRFVADVDGYVRDDLLRLAGADAEHDAAGRGAARRSTIPPVKALVVYGANPMSSNPDQARVRRGSVARGPVHGRDRAVPDRHRRLRRHRPARDDADRAPRRQRRLRAHVRVAEPAGGRPARRVPAGDRDVPPAGAGDGAGRAAALRGRRDAGAHAARRRRLRAAVARRLDAARLPDALRPVHRRLPDALGQARVLLASAPRPTVTTRCPATCRRR